MAHVSASHPLFYKFVFYKFEVVYKMALYKMS
jgi:hypothetical protein